MIFSLNQNKAAENNNETTAQSQESGLKPCAIKIPDCVDFEIADSNRERIKGLSDRVSLPENTGLLFVFENPAEQCIWMKDMRFPIDIIWLDENKTIRKIEQNVSPDTFPATFCFENTNYVLELNAGKVESSGLKLGQELSF
jgi:uncharacterized membrane protein (UPF0127 family)